MPKKKPPRSYWGPKRKFLGKTYLIGDIHKTKKEAHKDAMNWIDRRGFRHTVIKKSKKVKQLKGGSRKRGRYAVYIRK